MVVGFALFYYCEKAFTGGGAWRAIKLKLKGSRKKRWILRSQHPALESERGGGGGKATSSTFPCVYIPHRKASFLPFTPSHRPFLLLQIYRLAIRGSGIDPLIPPTSRAVAAGEGTETFAEGVLVISSKNVAELTKQICQSR